MSKEQRHMVRVKELPCCLCGAAGPSDAHHILEGRIPGRKAHDFCTIPLCKDCHLGGRNGIHGQQFMLKIMKENELNLLGETIKKLYGKV
ncbi:MAG: DUF968 domain-containing protein [Nitrosomonas sp.]|nr:DUF968 domain-containing protein [Nitrosomonas sp.]